MRYWVLARSQKDNKHCIEWYSSHYERGYVFNIKLADTYKTEEEAIMESPDDSWKPMYVDWFS